MATDTSRNDMPTHSDRRVLPHTPEQMFDLVRDIEKYPEFLPWCIATNIHKCEGEVLTADIVIGFKCFREQFITHVTCDRPRRIDVAYFEGPFKYLNNYWIFEPYGKDECEIEFFVDFEFRARIMQIAIGVVFNDAVQRMVSAFVKRAQMLYG